MFAAYLGKYILSHIDFLYVGKNCVSLHFMRFLQCVNQARKSPRLCSYWSHTHLRYQIFYFLLWGQEGLGRLFSISNRWQKYLCVWWFPLKEIVWSTASRCTARGLEGWFMCIRISTNVLWDVRNVSIPETCGFVPINVICAFL